ncbi:MAG: xanthine dehydrogenase molybdopterin binding subunit, partial [Polyangiales bacterium]
MKAVGKAIPHESAEGHVTGGALYTDDLVGRLPGALHAWPVQSPHARARVAELRTDAASATDGVVKVLTAADVPGENDTGAARHDEPLFPEEASYHGQPVAWVLAENEEAAREGAARVEIDWEPLEPVVDVAEAVDEGSFHTDPLRIRRGDPEGTLSGAAHVIEGELRVGGQEHFYLETQAAVAYTDETGELFVCSSTQHPTETQIICARVLGVPSHAVTCQSLRMGGAFGGKEVQANAYAAVAALGVHHTGRPVRVRLDRMRDMVMTGKRHPFLARYRAAHDDDGKLLALDVELFSDGGWSLDLSEPVMYRAMFHVDNCYFIPHVQVVGRVCRTNKTSQTAFRGFGGPQGMVVIEDILDRVARRCGLAPHEARQRNFYREGDITHYGQTVTQAERIEHIWRELSDDAELASRWDEIGRFNADHTHVKRGIAITPVKFGISFTTAFFNQAAALVLVYQDGSVQLNHGGTEMGQGLHTKMLQIAAQELGVALEQVRMMPTRTDKVPNTSATAASSGSDLNGAAVRAACATIRERLANVAAQHFGEAAGDLVFDNGRVHPPGAPEQALPFSEVTKRAYLQRIPLFATGYYRTPQIHFDKAAGQGKPFHYFAYGAAVCEVEVDGFTGQYATRRVDILHDVGDSLSPLVDRGQVEGGFAQGAGWLTQEEL